MAFHYIRNILRTFILIIFPFFPMAQENSAFLQPGSDIRLADDLYRDKNIGSARYLYDKIATDGLTGGGQNASLALYREAACAASLENKDAESLLDQFIRDHPENALISDASLSLGKIYFRENKYRDATKTFQKIDISKLARTEKEELSFMMGYSFLKSGELEKAMTHFRRISSHNDKYYPQASFYIAHIDFTLGDYEKALAGFDGLKYDKRFGKVIPVYELQIHDQLGQYSRVMEIGPSLLESTGTSNKADIAFITGNACFQSGDFSNAAYYLDVFERLNRKQLSREENYLIGYIKYAAGDFKDATGYFQKAARETDALSQSASYYLGVCYNETGQKKYAGNAFLSAYKNGSDARLSEESLFNYIKTSLEAPFNPYNESIALLEDYLEKNPHSPRAGEAYGYLSSLYFSSRNYRQALESMEASGTENEKLQEAYQKILFYRAAELFNAGDPDGALALYIKAAENGPDGSIRAESVYWSGEIMYRKEDYEGAKRAYEQFLRQPGAVNSDNYINTWYSLGYACFNSNEYDEAIRHFRKYLETGKARDSRLQSDTYVRLGDCFFINKKYDDAISYYDMAIKAKDPSTDYALYQKALSEGARGNFTRKTEVLKVLINNFPGSSYYDDGLYEMALAYILLNQEDQALIYLDRLEKSGQASFKATQASLRKGFIYFNRNDYGNAIRSFKTVIERQPGSQESQEALAALKNIYIETGEADQYFDFVKGLSFAERNASAEDSVYFEAAEKQYLEGKCEQAVSSFQKYQANFPEGLFIAGSYFYQAECYSRSGRPDLALEGYKKIAGLPRSGFSEPALVKASGMEWSAGNYAAALPLFEQLELYASDPRQVTASLEGQMRCHLRLGDISSAAPVAQKLLSAGQIQPELAGEAHCVLGKDFLAKNELEQAAYELGLASKRYGTETGAEALYDLAYISFLSGRPVEAEERIYHLAEKYTAFDYWVAKGFILLADIYIHGGNEFQARQTLESVIGNYEGPELGEIARQKLERLGSNEP